MKYETLRERRSDGEARCETRKNDHRDGSLVQLSRGIEELEACATDAESEVVGFQAQLDAAEVLHAKKIEEINTKIAWYRAGEADVVKLKVHLGEIKKKHQQEVEELKEELCQSTKKRVGAKKADRLTAHILALQRKHQTEVRKLNIRVETAVTAEKETKSLLRDLEDAEKKQAVEIKELREMHINKEMKALMGKMTNVETVHVEIIEELCTEHKLASKKLHAEIHTFQTKLEDAEKMHEEEIHALRKKHRRATEKTKAEIQTLRTTIEETEEKQAAERQEVKAELTSARKAGKVVPFVQKRSGAATRKYPHEGEGLTVKDERAATAEKDVVKLKEHILSIEKKHQVEIQKINHQLELAREAETDMIDLIVKMTTGKKYDSEVGNLCTKFQKASKAEVELIYSKAQKRHGEGKLVHRAVGSLRKLKKLF